jgi:peptidoglycan-associated lipoprotein
MKTLVQYTAPAVVAVALVVLVGACARRPFVPVAAAPAPVTRAAETPALPVAPGPAPVAAAPTSPPPAPAPVVAAAPAPRPAPAFAANDNVKAIHFDFDKSDVRPEDARILESNAAWLKVNPGQLLMIEGHSDERGTVEYNFALGDRRATAALNYLVAQGVKADRISVISYGMERPSCSVHTEGCWSQNRRSQFLVKEQ